MIVHREHFKAWALAPLVLAAGFLAATLSAESSYAEPGISSSSPQDGAVLVAAPEVLNLCFSEPVQTEGEDTWQFAVKPNGISSLGLRVVFLPDGSCVDVFPGLPDPQPQGIWTFEWSVKARSDSSDGVGVVSFQVGSLQPGQTPLPASDSANGGGDSTPPVALIALVVIGALIVVTGVAGFLVKRKKT